MALKIYKQPSIEVKTWREMGNLKFSTKVDIKQADKLLDYTNRILMLGSCFTTEIGALMRDYKFDVSVNPFGVLYNPCSIANSVERLTSCRHFVLEEVIQTNPTDATSAEKYATFWHHSSFARTSKEEFIENANKKLDESSVFLRNADTVIITLGTAWVFVNNANGEVVSNCHKRVAKEFTRKLLSVEECTLKLQEIADYLPDKNIIFTVSPIRHLKDGAHGNQISKATLLLSIENVVAQSPWCSYFPSYEIVLDELRDYRFYAEDMVHPSPLAVRYIFEKFKESNISPLAYKQMEDNMRLTKAENHIQK